jgi:hypothetical protein
MKDTVRLWQKIHPHVVPIVTSPYLDLRISSNGLSDDYLPIV